MQGREGPLAMVSGQANRVIPIQQGGWIRLRVVNASSSRFYRLRLEEHPFYLIATDGGALPSPIGAEEILLAPGERADVLVQGQRGDGSFRLLNLPYNRGGMGMMGGMGPISSRSTAEVLATVAYQGRADRAWSLPARLVAVEPLPPPVSPPRSFVLGMGMGMGMGMGRRMTFVINGRQFDPDRIDTRVQLNAVEDWEILNPHGMDHPFHVHTNAFQVLDGDGVPERAWRDTLLVRAGSRVRFRLQFNDYTGTTLYHCHILDHSDLGMMATLQIF
jgi:FtsP/CotA-like multicopper oxidase with cupredoxin domain